VRVVVELQLAALYDMCGLASSSIVVETGQDHFVQSEAVDTGGTQL